MVSPLCIYVASHDKTSVVSLGTGPQDSLVDGVVVVVVEVVVVVVVVVLVVVVVVVVV